MKNRRLLWIVLSAVLVLALAAFAAVYVTVRQAQTLHSNVQALHTQLCEAFSESCLSITENGADVGRFPLSALYTDDVSAQLDAPFSAEDLLPQDEFTVLTWSEQLRWYAGRGDAGWYDVLFSNAPFVIDLDGSWTLTPVFAALDAAPRTAAQDAQLRFNAERGAFEIASEQPGNELDTEAIGQALLTLQDGLQLSSDAPLTLQYELTDCSCYLLPRVTAETAQFDYAAALAQKTDGLTLRVRFSDHVEELSLADYLGVTDDGQLFVQQSALSAFLSQQQTLCAQENVPYLFESYDRGLVPIPFLTCSYALDTKTLAAQLREQLLHLDTSEIEARLLCTDANGEPYSLGDSYIAADIAAQTVTYYKDGELIVHSDVVTGLPGLRDTPTGLYQVVNTLEDCWLSGSDFFVHVDYWVGFIGTLYGLHDASWRDGEFGGEIYLTNGSHGCVNTPIDAMQCIYENVELGTPVLVF